MTDTVTAMEVAKVASQTDWLLEGVKLGSQLVGAMVVAYFTVRWALGRYKKEKVWERQVATLAELIEALTEMSTVQSRLHVEHIPDEEGREPDHEQKWMDQLHDRATKARNRINAAAANATIFLPDTINKAIETYMDEAEAIGVQYEHGELLIWEAYEKNHRNVEILRTLLIKEARSVTK